MTIFKSNKIEKKAIKLILKIENSNLRLSLYWNLRIWIPMKMPISNYVPDQKLTSVSNGNLQSN